MDNKQTFKNCYNRLTRQGIIKSLIIGLTVGFTLSLVVATLLWYFGSQQFWLSIVAFVGVTLVTTTVLALTKYKTNTKSIAKRLDSLGLEERVITMTELEGDNSVMAKLQRRDATKAFNGVNAKMLKLAVSVPLMVGITLAFVLNMGMTTVSALTAQGYMKSGRELFEELSAEPPVTCVVRYEAGFGGQILGDEEQVLVEGEDAVYVIALPDQGYVFICWSDGVADPYRLDKEVKTDMTLTAKFGDANAYYEHVMYGDGSPYMGSGDDSDGNNPANNLDSPSVPIRRPNQDDEMNEGLYNRADNQFYDGNTYYGGQNYTSASNAAFEQANSNTNLTDSERGAISDYFVGIAK